MNVVLLAAQSLDGRITHHATAGDAFTSPADKRHFRTEIRRCDACVMGFATYEQSKDRMRPDAFPALRRVVWTRTPEKRLADAVQGSLEFTCESPAETTRRLRADGRLRCALLGGGQVNAAWLAAGLVDEVDLTIEPRIFGQGIPLAGGLLSLDVNLSLIEARILSEGGPVLLRYKVNK